MLFAAHYIVFISLLEAGIHNVHADAGRRIPLLIQMIRRYYCELLPITNR